MTRWILSSIALHAALVIFVFISALLARPEKEEDILVVDLSPGFEQEEPEPEETPGEPEPEPTKEEEVTQVPTPKEEPTKEVTKKETPPPERTKKAEVKEKPTTKKTPIPVRTLPPDLRAKATPPPNREPRRVDPREKLKAVADEIEDLANEEVPDPPRPVHTPRKVERVARQTTEKSQLDIKPTGMGRHSSNFYFVIMQRQLYKNWDHRAREGSPRKGEVTVVVLKDGTIDINRCRWNNRSGDTTFDDSVWEAVKKTELPQFPAEFTIAEITVTVTFRDEV